MNPPSRPAVECALVAVLSGLVLVAGVAEAKSQTKPTPRPPNVALQTNLGTHHFPITTASKPAQRYFDQGIRLTYAFNHAEAIRSFEEALRHDPSAVMAYWGIANALGPNINAGMTPAQERRAVQALAKARAGAKKLSRREREYVAALSYRYSEAIGDHRKALDQKYAEAMRVLAHRRPSDLDAATLYAEALMNLSPWDYWTRDGRPKPHTLDIVATLERVLKHNPNHPGACHYYIHAVEASPQPERALPCADRLPALMPGAGHLVHMPAHIYMRLGRYAAAVERNLHAAHVDITYLRDRGAGEFYGMSYYPHTLHFLWAALLMEGRSREAAKAAAEITKTVTPAMVADRPELELLSPTSWFGHVRFGRWQAVLDEPAPPPALRYATGMWHFARGLAFSRLNRPEQADEERRLLGIVVDQMPASRKVGSNSARALLEVAEHLLVGELAAARDQEELAVQELETALAVEESLTYEEPPAWALPVRQLLGAVYLSFGRAAEAEQVYREDLRRQPHNGWSLFGLTQALTAQRKPEAAAVAQQRFRSAWARADVDLPASRF